MNVVFTPASPFARAISDLFVLTLVIAGIIFTIVAGLVVYIALRFRATPNNEAPRPEFGQFKFEITWTTASLLVVSILFGLTLNTMRVANPPVGNQKPDLVVIGHQWWWEVRYPSSQVITANEIHIPAGRRLLVRLESADVIHDFWVPQLARKMDMIPGHPNQMWLKADEPGVYLGACSEFCGVQHAWMRLRVIASPPNAFAEWQRQQLKNPSSLLVGKAAHGKELFQQLTCSSCHTIRGTPSDARLAPDLTHLASRRTLGAGVLENTPSNLTSWLANPQAIKPGSYMPNLHLSRVQVNALVAYLETLQ
jgi:cytochrome c oxidase subunit 2